MRTTFIYDLPTRIFHWLFAGLFLVSFTLAKTVDDESVLFSYHMLSGLLLGGLVVWRIVWGVLGSRHARFTDFSLNPREFKNYLMGIVTGAHRRWAGHNPASSWAALTMFLLSIGLAVTGYLMSTGSKEAFEDVHELMANTFIVIVVLHVSGVVLHSLRHRDAIALSMVDGKKQGIDEKESIRSGRSFSAVVLLALFVSAGIYLFKNFDQTNGSLQVFGQTLQLGEGAESGESSGHDLFKKIDKEDDDD